MSDLARAVDLIREMLRYAPGGLDDNDRPRQKQAAQTRGDGAR